MARGGIAIRFPGVSFQIRKRDVLDLAYDDCHVVQFQATP